MLSHNFCILCSSVFFSAEISVELLVKDGSLNSTPGIACSWSTVLCLGISILSTLLSDQMQVHEKAYILLEAIFGFRMAMCLSDGLGVKSA